MPPKGSKKKIKVNADDTTEGAGLLTPPALDDNKDDVHEEDKDEEAKEKAVVKKTTKKKSAKAMLATEWNVLPNDSGDSAAITVYSDSKDSVPKPDGDGKFTLLLKLRASDPFQFLKTTVTTFEGQKDCVTLNFKPARPFPFMNLSPEIRKMIIKLAVAPVDQSKKIHITAGPKGLQSKLYTQGLPNRLGFMRASKELHVEARSALYSIHFKFDDTTALMNFLIRGTTEMRRSLRRIEVFAYKKQSAESALSALSECTSLQFIHFSTGVAANASPTKAARVFFGVANHFLRSLIAAGPKESTAEARIERAVGVVHFGKSHRCFSVKEGDGEIRAWTAEERETFEQTLKRLLK